MNVYISTKIVQAEECSLLESMKRRGKPPGDVTDAPGYHIVYTDRYESWCPKEEFERVYRVMSPAEAAFAKTV